MPLWTLKGWRSRPSSAPSRFIPLWSFNLTLDLSTDYDLSDDTHGYRGRTLYQGQAQIVRANPLHRFSASGLAPAYGDENIDFDEPTWRVGLDHRISEDVMGVCDVQSGVQNRHVQYRGQLRFAGSTCRAGDCRCLRIGFQGRISRPNLTGQWCHVHNKAHRPSSLHQRSRGHNPVKCRERQQ